MRKKTNPKIRRERPKSFDIIVPTHGRLDLTMRCIRAIYDNTTCPFHLVIVDDSTPDLDDETDMTPEWFERFCKKHDNITFIHSGEPYKEGNQFFNIALKQCKNEFVATVMNSIEVQPEWELSALHLLESQPKIGAVGFKCLYPYTDTIESAGIGFMGIRPVDVGKHLPAFSLANVYECIAVQWALAMFRRKALGVLEEGIYNGFKGWDDIDNSFVLRKKGWKIFYCGAGTGIHFPRATRGRKPEDTESRILNMQNMETFHKRWGLWDAYKKATHKPEDYEGVKIDGVRTGKNQTTV